MSEQNGNNTAAEPSGQRKLKKYAISLAVIGVLALGVALVLQTASYDELTVGDTLFFGKYPFTAEGELQPIEWQVLRRDPDGLLVMAIYGIDSQPYNDEMDDMTWAKCSLRQWLNEEFFSKAFSEAEQQQVMTVPLANPDNIIKGVPGGPDTKDKVFLLSFNEACALFSEDAARKCSSSPYLTATNAEYRTGRCRYWLRSTGNISISAAGVNLDGEVHDNYFVTFNNMAVRPVIKIAF